jgi:prepilin-type processing-associated H-X9-DG protein
MKSSHNAANRHRAFTRAELLAVLSALGLLATVALPALSVTRGHSERILCLSNLRQIGRAVHLWGNERGDGYPVWTDWSAGGLYNAPAPFNSLKQNIYFHFLWMTNELPSPRILACPADPLVKAATDFSRSLQGGFDNPAFRNNAVSYTLVTDSFTELPNSILCSDRNVRSNGLSNCSAGYTSIASIYRTPADTAWLPAIHGEPGNILFFDGRAQAVSKIELDRAFQTGGDIGTTHVLYPR